ncbi:MAG: hypothetical protein ACKVP3_19850 [Hyphomicrobiaceae bacterium]
MTVAHSNNQSVGTALTPHESDHPATQNGARLSESKSSVGKFNGQRESNAVSSVEVIRPGFRSAVMVKQDSAPLVTAALWNGAKPCVRLARD